MATFDLIIIGTGITGLAAARQAAKDGLVAAMLEERFFGGLVVNINELEGEVEGSGSDVAAGMMREAAKLGVKNLTARASAIASEPADVRMVSPVAMLSLTTTGIPWSGPRTRPALRSASIRSAMLRASGFSSMMLRSAGPVRSTAAIRARYCSTSARDDVAPAVMRRCNSATPTSSSANGRAGGCDRSVAPPPTAATSVRNSRPRRAPRGN